MSFSFHQNLTVPPVFPYLHWEFIASSSHYQCLKLTLFSVLLPNPAMALLYTLQQRREVKICFSLNKTTLWANRSYKARRQYLRQIKSNNFISSLLQVRCYLQCQLHHLPLQWLLDLPKPSQEVWYLRTLQGMFSRQRRNIKSR